MSGWGTVPYDQQACARYRDAGLWRDVTIPTQFGEVVRAYRDAPAVITSSGRWSYAELDHASDAVAAGFLDAGLRPGESVILQVNNSIHTVAAWYGLLKAGLIPVCTLAAHRRREIEPIARKVKAAAHLVQAGLSFDLVSFAGEIRDQVPGIRALFTIGAASDDDGIRIEDLESRAVTSADRDNLRQVAAQTDLTAPAVFQLSGGTTGTPKVIPRLHPEYFYNAVATARWWDLGPGDRLAYGLPLVHNAGIVNALHAAHCCGAALLLTTPAADDLLPLMAAEGATWLTTTPGLAGEYLGHPAFDAAFASVKNCVLTATRTPESIFSALEGRGVHVTQAFGMSEGLLMFTPSDAGAELRAKTVGMPISPLDEVRLLEPGGLRQVAQGAAGELCVRGPYTIRGYLDAPQHNAIAFTPDGFYRTGDIVLAHSIDGLTAYSIEGRIKDLINRGGEKINAEEVETILERHDAIAEAALVAMPDERLGERACAYLVIKAGRTPPTLTSLAAFLAEQGLAKFKWPERIELRDSLPRNPIGKLVKRALRADIEQLLGSPESGLTQLSDLRDSMYAGLS
jgi:2,3-dihydroxybenzoate-AMP ligase